MFQSSKAAKIIEENKRKRRGMCLGPNNLSKLASLIGEWRKGPVASVTGYLGYIALVWWTGGRGIETEVDKTGTSGKIIPAVSNISLFQSSWLLHLDRLRFVPFTARRRKKNWQLYDWTNYEILLTIKRLLLVSLRRDDDENGSEKVAKKWICVLSNLFVSI